MIQSHWSYKQHPWDCLCPKILTKKSYQKKGLFPLDNKEISAQGINSLFHFIQASWTMSSSSPQSKPSIPQRFTIKSDWKWFPELVNEKLFLTPKWPSIWHLTVPYMAPVVLVELLDPSAESGTTRLSCQHLTHHSVGPPQRAGPSLFMVQHQQ